MQNIPKNLTKAYEIFQSFPEDFFPNGQEDREDSPPQEREDLEE